MAARRRGATHNFFIDGQGDARRSERKSSLGQLDYRLWRESVFGRDDWTCVLCGRRGGRLVADHIKSWRYNPELRFDLDNGRTLCDPCHTRTPNYGRRAHERQIALG
jgi:5-methylcytosine-specific restriction endonuclease McrA